MAFRQLLMLSVGVSKLTIAVDIRQYAVKYSLLQLNACVTQINTCHTCSMLI